MPKIKPRIIIVADDERAAVMVNDTYIPSAEELHFTAIGGDGTMLSLKTDGWMCNALADRNEFFDRASKILGYKLSGE